MNRFFDDFTRVSTGLLAIALGVKDEVKQHIRRRADKCAREMDFVSREEFEVVKDMAQMARLQNDELRKEVETLLKKKTR